jgi:hypothetical protein
VSERPDLRRDDPLCKAGAIACRAIDLPPGDAAPAIDAAPSRAAPGSDAASRSAVRTGRG